MADISSRQWQHDERPDLSWEGDSREDKQAVILPRRNSRRKSAPKNSNEEEEKPSHAVQEGTPSPPQSTQNNKSTTRSSKHKRRDLVRSRHQDTRPVSTTTTTSRRSTPDPVIFHSSASDDSLVRTPLHHFMNPPFDGNEDNNTPRESLRKGKRQLLYMLNAKDGLNNDNDNNFPRKSSNSHNSKSKKNAGYSNRDGDGNDTDEISTASTSGSNLSSSTSEDGMKSQEKDAASMTTTMDSDKELELYSRQIRMELRQAEMLELAQEAERAAASGQKSFTGRASTFRDDSELELPLEGENIKSHVSSTPSSQRKVRRALDFGTPLVRRLQPEPAKISVVALRDVSEVVPSFKDFHLHLRTHFLRRRVDERVLIFSERDAPLKFDSTENNDNNMIHLWNSFNFGTWASSSKRSVRQDGIHAEAGFIVETIKEVPSKDSNCLDDSSSTNADVGEMLSEHMHTTIRGSRGLRRPRVEVPPGLTIFEQENLGMQPKSNENTHASGSLAETLATQEDQENPESHPSTPKQTKNAEAGTLETTSTTPFSEENHDSPPRNEKGLCHAVQDGSPHSPIFVDDVDLDESYTPSDARSSRVYQGPNPPPGLPLTPQANFHDVFDTKFTTPKDTTLREQLVVTQVGRPDEADGEFLGPDFVTPVRLRDIRDRKLMEHPDFLARLPHAPLVPDARKNSLLAEPPNSICYQSDSFPNQNGPSNSNRSSILDYNETGGGGSGGGDDKRANRIRLAQRKSTRGYDHTGTLRSSVHSAVLEKNLDIRASALGKPARLHIDLVDCEKTPANLDIKYWNGRDTYARSARPIIQSVSMPSLGRYGDGARNEREFPAVPIGVSDDVCHRPKDDLKQTVGESTKEGMRVMPSDRQPTGNDLETSEGEGLKRSRPPGEIGRPSSTRNLPSSDQRESIYVEENDYANETSILVVDLEGMDKTEVIRECGTGDSKQADESKATAEFGCECLISPASSLDSEFGGIQKAQPPKQHKSLQSMFSNISPTSSRRLMGSVVYASSKENDDFMSNYLYCSKTEEAAPNPEPICSGSAPCQDTKIPCGEIAVDSCVGNFMESAWKFFPKRSSEGKKLLSLSRDHGGNLQSKPLSWYDLANEKFDRLLESFIGNEHKYKEQNRLAYQAPTLKVKTAEQQTPETPTRYDEDLEAVVYVRTVSSLELTASNSYSSHHSSELEGLRRRVTGMQKPRQAKNRGRYRRQEQNCRLQHSLSDTAQLNQSSSNEGYMADSRYSM